MRRLLAEGHPGTGRIVGIRVFMVGSDESSASRVDEYALEVPAIGRTVGVRQALRPAGLVRLGMDVQLRHDDERAVIDWEQTCGGAFGASRFIKRVPEPGIVDETLALKHARARYTPASLVIEETRVIPALLGMVRALLLDVEMRVEGEDPVRAEVPIGAGPPHYATHLCDAGIHLPAWINPRRRERPIVDWPAAAMADPGVGRPPSAVLGRLGELSE